MKNRLMLLASTLVIVAAVITAAAFGLAETQTGGDIPQFSINGQPLRGQIDISTGSNLSYMQWSKDGVTHIRVNMREDDVRKMVDEEITKWAEAKEKEKGGNSTSTR